MFKSQRYHLFFSCIRLASSSSKTLYTRHQVFLDKTVMTVSLLEGAHLIKDGLIDKEVSIQGGGCLVLPVRWHVINCVSRWGLKSFMESKPTRPKKGRFLISKGLCRWSGVHSGEKGTASHHCGYEVKILTSAFHLLLNCRISELVLLVLTALYLPTARHCSEDS